MAPASQGSVRELVTKAACHCLEARVPAGTRNDLQIVLAELLNNIVEHGIAGHQGGILDLAITVEPGGIRCELRDDGAPLPGHRLPEGRMPRSDVPLGSLPEGGFGVGLVRALARELVYLRAGRENRTSFLLPMRGSCAPCRDEMRPRRCRPVAKRSGAGPSRHRGGG
ncbi:Anti-sigma regulatory factor (Ser/Thr protein kinase) [Meinhardsimonia xiamenensis]|jgi:serine/threonine-protein kinase RsbW|uniref:Anti-sigma regulatory factor (Ser/Thr protein kinase) n=2 Tax=Meinhardsimonia xiamenensis TaxID=990712 RepID=A0A1G8YN47_9RHOB|nr:ATP-binding protein [Meinhardsimonia xiamenensis]PRX37367.1 anti-sigma regulatory factor (Ser/Thr protein kinase) [Meinhardsimonia xiamenensis]SDK04173.1 Anti-sigma regulatory factor (Ser/Thr protein kinase) [Meinhardsimonia xiamenensis]